MIIVNGCNKRTSLHNKRVMERGVYLRLPGKGFWERTLGMRPGKWKKL